jgi:hypothetical protein
MEGSNADVKLLTKQCSRIGGCDIGRRPRGLKRLSGGDKAALLGYTLLCYVYLTFLMSGRGGAEVASWGPLH